MTIPATRVSAKGARQTSSPHVPPGEQILVSSLLKALVESSGKFEFGEAQDVELKGLSGSHHVIEVDWQAGG